VWVVSSGRCNRIVFCVDWLEAVVSRRAGGRSYRWLSPVERERVAARVLAGDRVVDVVAAFGSSRSVVYRVVDEAWVARRRVGDSRYRLSFGERERISRGIAAGRSGRAIARELGRAASTVCREIGGCGGRERYRGGR
jgi:Helix-turn-helix domain